MRKHFPLSLKERRGNASVADSISMVGVCLFATSKKADVFSSDVSSGRTKRRLSCFGRYRILLISTDKFSLNTETLLSTEKGPFSDEIHVSGHISHFQIFAIWSETLRLTKKIAVLVEIPTDIFGRIGRNSLPFAH